MRVILKTDINHQAYPDSNYPKNCSISISKIHMEYLEEEYPGYTNFEYEYQERRRFGSYSLWFNLTAEVLEKTDHPSPENAIHSS